MISFLKKRLRPIKIIYTLIMNYYYDFSRYYRYTSRTNYQKNLEANIIKHYHVLEKGLSMPVVKQGFGVDVATSLISLCERYIENGYSLESKQFLSALSVLEKYINYNSKYYDLTDMKKGYGKITRELVVNKNQTEGGFKYLTKDEIIKSANSGFMEFSACRYSVRNYTDEEVDINLLKEAIKVAQKTPSACNRQSSKVYVVCDKNLINKVLGFQNGNRGFGHLANKLLIVTNDLRVFEGVHERNQSFIDGGMFAMSLLYGLHYNGLGACPLNWSTTTEVDRKFKKAVGINDSENIMMMISVGHLQDSFKVAVSKRRDIEEVLSFM
ncbi:nitroreductase family protein [Paenibacillus montanisoli]|uniref:Nitroreductase n=1 Tax=Paenibacillus montanisoli TaxID=2081970 RepID=A0A328TWR6_9BACL|nr:nitroreductase family protein [Paenibacillus montanisoli]RAP74003.1 nitroreductase [Paenibacillus montanisoli]